MNDTRETFVGEIVDNVTDYGSYDEHDTNTDQTYLPPNENTSNLRPYGFELFIVEGICLNSVGKYNCGQKILSLFLLAPMAEEDKESLKSLFAYL